MNKRTWRKQHKWIGIGMTFFLVMFCVSGILLNHRSLIKGVDVSRKYLPSNYKYEKWSGGLLRGTLALDNKVLLYGNSGIWQTDSTASFFADLNKGLPEGADNRQIRNIVKTDNGEIMTVSPFALYNYGEHETWHKMELPLEDDEKLTDIASHGDTLVVLSRSYAYISVPPYKNFRRVQLGAPKNYKQRVTLFRTIWLLHSGELFGSAGKVAVDFIAVVLVLLCITGAVFAIRPKQKALLRLSLKLHDKIGRYTIALTLLIVLTGWCLRPPVMIALVLNKIPAIPGTTLRSNNPWNDKLRMIRYDKDEHDWLVSTSEGFYSLKLNNGAMKKIESAPPVSVMGLNVLQKDANGKWYCGSFSGLFVWDRQKGTATDYFTHKPAPKKAGAPFGKKAIAGMSQDFVHKSSEASMTYNRSAIIADYYDGTTIIAQPSSMNYLPMSLWNVALEIHSGRFFIGNIATYIFIFVMGILAIWCLWSGFYIRLAKKKGK